MRLTDTQYKVLLALYHEFNEAFKMLAPEVQEAFAYRLYGNR